MRKTIAAALAAITFTGALATAAEARPRHRHHDNDGAAIAAGIAGLAIGAAIASNGRDRYYDRGYYGRGYYDGPRYRSGYYDRGYYGPPRYAYGPPRGYRNCRTMSRFDPYYGGYVRSTRCW